MMPCEWHFSKLSHLPILNIHAHTYIVTPPISLGLQLLRSLAMAMQTGIGLSRIVLIAGAGYTGTILLKNGKLSDILGELQNLVKQGEPEGDTDYSDAIATQVRRLAMEVRQLASSRQITVLNGSSTQSNLSSLIVPAATVGALGYGYMWWKGLSFSDLMYVTKQNMANAVSNLTKNLEHVSDALAAAKKHLTQRIENLDGKIDEQIEISRLIRTEVTDVRDDLSQIGFDLESLQRMVSGLDGKLLSLEEKQEITSAGVMYLCGVVNGKKLPMPKQFQEQLQISGNSTPSLMGLKGIVDSPRNLLTDGNTQDSSDKLNKSLSRTVSNKC